MKINNFTGTNSGRNHGFTDEILFEKYRNNDTILFVFRRGYSCVYDL